MVACTIACTELIMIMKVLSFYKFQGEGMVNVIRTHIIWDTTSLSVEVLNTSTDRDVVLTTYWLKMLVILPSIQEV